MEKLCIINDEWTGEDFEKAQRAKDIEDLRSIIAGLKKRRENKDKEQVRSDNLKEAS